MPTQQQTLQLVSLKNVLGETILIVLGVAIPVVVHLIPGINVFILLPMHWTIFIAGMLYGWKGGLIAGIVTPNLSFLMTGMPFPAILPFITVELALFGGITGMLREKSSINGHIVLLVASITGRAAYLFMALGAGQTDTNNLPAFAATAFMPGVITALLIILTVPYISSILMKKIQ